MLDEDLQCPICCYEFSRSDHVPRMLHCDHTFCAPCLEAMSEESGFLRIVKCPLCRWITCTRANLGLLCSLWVNTKVWDKLAEGDREKERRSTDSTDATDTTDAFSESPFINSQHVKPQFDKCTDRPSCTSRFQKALRRLKALVHRRHETSVVEN